MIERRIMLIVTLALGFFLAPLAAETHPAGKIPRRGLLSSFSPSEAALWHARYAEGRNDRLPDLAADLVRLGLSFDQILAALTTVPAERFKAASRTGRIAVGMDADLVVFAGDPRADIRALTRVRHVLHRGRPVYRDDVGRSPR